MYIFIRTWNFLPLEKCQKSTSVTSLRALEISRVSVNRYLIYRIVFSRGAWWNGSKSFVSIFYCLARFQYFWITASDSCAEAWHICVAIFCSGFCALSFIDFNKQIRIHCDADPHVVVFTSETNNERIYIPRISPDARVNARPISRDSARYIGGEGISF